MYVYIYIYIYVYIYIYMYIYIYRWLCKQCTVDIFCQSKKFPNIDYIYVGGIHEYKIATHVYIR